MIWKYKFKSKHIQGNVSITHFFIHITFANQTHNIRIGEDAAKGRRFHYINRISESQKYQNLKYHNTEITQFKAPQKLDFGKVQSNVTNQGVVRWTWTTWEPEGRGSWHSQARFFIFLLAFSGKIFIYFLP